MLSGLGWSALRTILASRRTPTISFCGIVMTLPHERGARAYIQAQGAKTLFGLVGFGLLFSLLFGPTLFYDLAGAAEGERIGWDIFRDGSRSGDIGASSDPNGCNQDAVTAYEDSVFDDGFVFAHAVVVASDRARTDVHFLTDFGVSQISQMVGFRTFAQAGLLEFGEIADVRLFANFAARTQVAVGAEGRAGSDHRVFEDASRLHQHLVSNFAAQNHAVGANPRVTADAGGTAELNTRFDHGIGADFDVAVDHASFGIKNRNSLIHQLPALCHAHVMVDL